jgi:hypothetical protein
MKIKVKKVANGYIVSLCKYEVFCANEAEGRAKVRDLFMSDVAPVLADTEAERLFPSTPVPET